MGTRPDLDDLERPLAKQPDDRPARYRPRGPPAPAGIDLVGRSDLRCAGDIRRAALERPEALDRGRSDRDPRGRSTSEIETPARYWYWPKRLRRSQRWHREELIPAAWHLVSLVPFGFAVAILWRGPRPLLAAGGGSLSLSLVLLGGTIFLSGRHPYVYDVVAQACGGLFGGWLALGRIGRRRESSQGLG